MRFVGSDLLEYTCYGKYGKVEAFRELAFSWNWKNEPNHESEEAVLLMPIVSETKMAFRHFHLNLASSYNYEAGWKSTFGKLARALADSP